MQVSDCWPTDRTAGSGDLSLVVNLHTASSGPRIVNRADLPTTPGAVTACWRTRTSISRHCHHLAPTVIINTSCQQGRCRRSPCPHCRGGRGRWLQQPRPAHRSSRLAARSVISPGQGTRCAGSCSFGLIFVGSLGAQRSHAGCRRPPTFSADAGLGTYWQGPCPRDFDPLIFARWRCWRIRNRRSRRPSGGPGQRHAICAGINEAPSRRCPWKESCAGKTEENADVHAYAVKYDEVPVYMRLSLAQSHRRFIVFRARRGSWNLPV